MFLSTSKNSEDAQFQKSLHTHLGCINPREYWDKPPTSTGAGFVPSTVWLLRNFKFQNHHPFLSTMGMVCFFMRFQDTLYPQGPQNHEKYRF